MGRFSRFHAKFGLGFECEPVSEESLASYAGKLPPELLEEWRTHGWCGHGDGFLWTVNPDDLDDALADFLDDSSGCYAFLRTAFGGILYWDGTDAHYLDVLELDTSLVFRQMDMLFDGMLCDESYLKEVMRYDIFKKVLPKLGRLKQDECYGFLPPLAMGGPGTVDTVRRVKLREHLAILAQLDRE